MTNRYEHTDSRPVANNCCRCGEPIHTDDGLYSGDDYYDIDGDIVCEDCIQDYIKEFKHRA